jgi:AcrR family transcriptional regulator
MTNHTLPKKTQVERTKFSKEKIIREAILYFGKYGYRGATLAEMSKAAGLTEPGLLHHFSNKENLLKDVLEERDRVYMDRLNSVQKEGVKVLEELQAMLDLNATTPGLVQLFTVLAAESIDPTHPAHEFFTHRYQMITSFLSDALAKAQAVGKIRKDICPKDLAVMIFALMDGLQVQWLLEPEKVHMSKVFGLFLQTLDPDFSSESG